MAISRAAMWAAWPVACVLAAVGVAFLAGCDARTGPPTAADGSPVESVAVNPTDPAEADAARELLNAEVKYAHSLNVLHAYYVRTGGYDKQRWVERELKNLTEARTWRYEGVERPPAPAAQSVENATEAVIVEQVVAARQAWTDALTKLEDHYRQGGLNFKLALIRNVQQRFDPVHAYSYFLHAEVPPATLRPVEVVPAADELFAKALALHQQGKPLPLVTDYRKQRKALGMFRKLVQEHPNSTKIALSAYYIGDIYKEYFNEDIRAVRWYQRAWEWDPKIMKPARFQAAVVYDLRLHQRGKAVRLYQEAIKHEQFNRSNASYAAERIKVLTQEK